MGSLKMRYLHGWFSSDRNPFVDDHPPWLNRCHVTCVERKADKLNEDQIRQRKTRLVKKGRGPGQAISELLDTRLVPAVAHVEA
jgi:hypothetical protein